MNTYHGKPCSRGHGTLRYRAGKGCVECQKSASKTRYRNGKRWGKYDAEHRRSRSLLVKYGLTPEDYDALFMSQGGLCGICGGSPTGKHQRFHVDHDHETSRVRALLCGKCNIGLGSFDDSPEKLQKAAAYIRAHNLRR